MCVSIRGGGGGGLLGTFGGAVWLNHSNPDHSLDQTMEFSRTIFQTLVS